MYPSNPDIGIGIQQYEYQYIDNVIDPLKEDILLQVHTFLPDVPLQSVNISTTEISSKTVLLIYFTFIDNGNIDTSVVASTKINNIIDFEISL